MDQVCPRGKSLNCTCTRIKECSKNKPKKQYFNFYEKKNQILNYFLRISRKATWNLSTRSTYLNIKQDIQQFSVFQFWVLELGSEIAVN